jgi:hypothetical protein
VIRRFRLAFAGALALLLGVAPLAPLHAQAGGLLGDSDVMAGKGGEGGKRDAPKENRKKRSTRVMTMSPYLEVDQSAIVDLKGGNGDVLTYTSVAAGINASIQTRSVSVGADLRYEHQFAWGSNSSDQDIVSGIVNEFSGADRRSHRHRRLSPRL